MYSSFELQNVSETFYTRDNNILTEHNDWVFEDLDFSDELLSDPFPLTSLPSEDTVQQTWQEKSMEEWSCSEVLNFISSVLLVECLDDSHSLDRLRYCECISGCSFKDWSEDFCKMVCGSKEIGEVIFRAKTHLLQQNNGMLDKTSFPSRNLQYTESCNPEIWSNITIKIPSNNGLPENTQYNTHKSLQNISETPSCEIWSDVIIKVPSSSESERRPPTRRPGRPKSLTSRRKTQKRSEKLWEFIINLLKSSKTSPELIRWEDYEEGTFKFVQSEKVAKLWGARKENGNMNYEKFSRALRYYYKSKILQAVPGKRLVYKFGPQAKGWQFQKPVN